MSSIRTAAQAFNAYIKSCMEVKLLDPNVYNFLSNGIDKETESLRDDPSKYPLNLCRNQMKDKMTDKYIGNIFASSAHSTITDWHSGIWRHGRWSKTAEAK